MLTDLHGTSAALLEVSKLRALTPKQAEQVKQASALLERLAKLKIDIISSRVEDEERSTALALELLSLLGPGSMVAGYGEYGS